LTAVSSGRCAGPALALTLIALSASAGGWDARFGEPLQAAGFRGPVETAFAGPALLVEGRRSWGEGWDAEAGSCVLRTVFDPVDGVEHAGTGAWLEVDTAVDHAAREPGERSAWGASLSDWHHEAAFWLVRSGRREGVVLESGGVRSDFLPLDVSRTRRYLLVADETGAHLAVDGEPLLSVPLARRRQPGPPAVRIGRGAGNVSVSLSAVDHGCLRPVDAQIESEGTSPPRLAVLGHEGFRPGWEIEPGSLRVEGVEPAAGSLREDDVNGDGFADLLFDLPEDLRPTPGELLHLDAKTSEGIRLRGWSAASTR
jgi:hypothetical protein